MGFNSGFKGLNVGLWRTKHLRTDSVTSLYAETMPSALRASSFALYERNPSKVLIVYVHSVYRFVQCMRVFRFKLDSL